MKITPLVLLPVAASLDSSYSAENLLAAVGHRNVTKMEALVQGLAEESIKEPHLKMDADIQEALKAIRTMFVKSIQDSLMEQHKADQESHNCGIQECFERCESEKHIGIGTCGTFQETCDKKKVTHETCRSNVYSLYVDMATKCGKLHCFDVPEVKCKYEGCLCPDLLYCARGHKKDCSSDTSPIVCEAVEGSCTSDPKDGYGAWLQQTITKYRAAWKEWNHLWTQCSAAYKEFLYTDVECDGYQKEFESCMCEKSAMFDTFCGPDYANCRDACWSWYEESVPPLQCQEKDRKIDWSSTKKIECYLDILLHEYTKEELLAKCGTEDCINVARQKDYEHCSKICTEVDFCGEWGQCDIMAGNGWYGVVVDTHEFRHPHDQYHLGDNKYKCDTNGEGVFTEHRNRQDRRAEHRCTEHLDIDFQVPPAPVPCDPQDPVCGPQFHCDHYAQFDNTEKIGISDCCPEGGKGSCFPDKTMVSCDGDGGAYAAGWMAKLKFITFGEHTHAWAFNRCDCQECTYDPPTYPTPPYIREPCSGIHKYPGECSKHSAYAAGSEPRRTVQSTWKNHFDAFGAQDLDMIMLDYTSASVLESYEFPTGSLVTATGKTQIREFFKNLFKQLSDTSGLTAPVLEVTGSPAQVFLVWTAPTSGVMSATDSFFFAEDNTILRQNIVWTQGTKSAAYSEMVTYPTLPAKELVSMHTGYTKHSVQAAWDNHFNAFGKQDVEAIMQDYTEKSQLRAFDHSTGILTTANGLAQIQRFFEGIFDQLSDTSGLTAPIVHVTDSPASKQVYLVWTCPTSGILSATDSFLFAADNKILRQNIAFTSM